MAETIGRAGSSVFLEYISDNSLSYNIRTTQQNATAIGATATTRGSHPNKPKHMKIRHVYGVASSGERARIPILDPTDSKFVSGGTFSKFGLTFTIEGKIGEKRFAPAAA